jgi:Domain of unknown function (DUF4331)
MSHHASGPNFGFPRGDARLDMTDLYAFLKTGDAGKSIIVLNVHPSFRLDSPEPTTTEPFKPGALYEVKVDTNGYAVADVCYGVQFASSEDGRQTATVRRVQGERAIGVCDDGEVLIEEAPVSVGREALVTNAGDYRFFFGWRSDPFFFDVNGNFNHMQFTGDDFFADKNVCSIVIELPNSALGSNEVGIWPAQWTKLEKAGSRQIGVEDRCRRFSSLERRGRRTLAESQPMMIVSSACSRTNWNTRAGIQPRLQRPSREGCFQTFCTMIRISRCTILIMAGH